MSRKAATVEKPALYPLHVAAGELGCSENHVYRLIASGALRAVDIAEPGARRSKTRIRADDLADYIDSLTRG